MSLRKLCRITLNASVEAYGIRVSGSKYFAGRPVMGHSYFSAERSLRRVGKYRRYTTSSLNVMNVLEHFSTFVEFGRVDLTCSELYIHKEHSDLLS